MLSRIDLSISTEYKTPNRSPTTRQFSLPPHTTHTLPYPTLPYPTLPYPTLPYPTLPYPTLPCPALPYTPGYFLLTFFPPTILFSIRRFYITPSHPSSNSFQRPASSLESNILHFCHRLISLLILPRYPTCCSRITLAISWLQSPPYSSCSQQSTRPSAASYNPPSSPLPTTNPLPRKQPPPPPYRSDVFLES